MSCTLATSAPKRVVIFAIMSATTYRDVDLAFYMRGEGELADGPTFHHIDSAGEVKSAALTFDAPRKWASLRGLFVTHGLKCSGSSSRSTSKIRCCAPRARGLIRPSWLGPSGSSCSRAARPHTTISICVLL